MPEKYNIHQAEGVADNIKKNKGTECVVIFFSHAKLYIKQCRIFLEVKINVLISIGLWNKFENGYPDKYFTLFKKGNSHCCAKLPSWK